MGSYLDEEMSYELIFEVLMREKNREDLQRMDAEFYDEALRFIEEERNLTSPDNHVGYQRVRNLQNMLREIYSRREQKIITLAAMNARSGRQAIDQAALLPHEKSLFEDLSGILKKTRSDRLEGEITVASSGASRSSRTEQVVRPNLPEPEPEAESEPEDVAAPQDSAPDTVEVVFTEPVGKFIGEELEPYGPYDKDDTATLPASIAKILEERGQAKIKRS